MILNNFSRRTQALFWCVAIGIVIGILIKYEMIQVLYVLATITLVFLLLIVDFADLEKIGVSSKGFGAKEE
ncbi:hypothetical protein BH10ACI1_BH10ACI1_22900 [soil metagenome]